MTIDIAKLRELLATSTSRPWRRGSIETKTVFMPDPNAIDTSKHVLYRLNTHDPYKRSAPTDAALIVEAVNALTELLDAYEGSHRRTFDRPPEESYVRVTVSHGGYTFEPALEWRDGDHFELRAQQLKAITETALRLGPTDPMAAAKFTAIC